MRFGKPRKNQRRVNPRYHLNESAKIENNSSKNMHDVQFYLEEFYPFAKEALGFDQDATIVFESDFNNAKNPLGKTAHYDPSNSTVTVYVDKRHPKDVMRSVSHELVHHAQNMRGDLQGGAMEEGYAQTDDHLREMEKEAYTKGNMLFRDWTDSRSNPDSQKDIMARIMQEWGYDETALTEEGGGFEEGQLVTVVASALAIDGEKTGTVVSYEDPAVLIKLDDDQEVKYVPDDNMVKVKKDFVDPRAEAGFDDVMGEEEKVTEMYDDDGWGDDDLDMAALEKEFPWLAKDVKTREAPPEVAADLADEFGDKDEPEEEEEPIEMKEASGEPQQGDDVAIISGGLAGAYGEVMELTTTMDGEPAVVVYLRKDADSRIMGAAGDEVVAKVSDVEVDRGIQAEKLSPEDKEWHKSVMDKGKVPNLKGDMDEIPGMEGPFQFKSGAVLYYDPKVGKYYDRGKDMYLDREEAAMLTMEDTENKNITGDNEMNIEEIVRAAVRRALEEKKYRREDEEEKVEEATEEVAEETVEEATEETTEETVTEGATDEEFEKLDAIVAAMGPEEALQALVQALPSHITHEMLDYIGQQYEIPLGGDEIEDFEGFDESKGLSAGQEELDLDDDGEIEASDLAGLRAGKTDDEVGEEVNEDVPTPTVMRGPFDPSQIQSTEDPEFGGMIHVLPNVELSGDVEQDTYDMAGGDENLESWLWGELESGDAITDPAGQHVYSGSDIQDIMRAIEDDANNPASSVHWENKTSDKEWYDSALFESLKKKWAK